MNQCFNYFARWSKPTSCKKKSLQQDGQLSEIMKSVLYFMMSVVIVARQKKTKQNAFEPSTYINLLAFFQCDTYQMLEIR